MAFDAWLEGELPDNELSEADLQAIEKLNQYTFINWITQASDSDKEEDSFAEVCLTKFGDKYVVIKFVSDDSTFAHEVDVLQTLQGLRHVIPLLDTFSIEPVGCYAMTFDRYSFNIFGYTITLQVIQDYMKFLLDAISYIHSQRIVHRDIKPENIGIKIQKGVLETLVLADFGLSCSEDAVHEEHLVGTASYMATEMNQKCTDEPLTKAVDLFSAGVIFAELLRGKDGLIQNRLGEARRSLNQLDKNLIGWLHEQGIQPDSGAPVKLDNNQAGKNPNTTYVDPLAFDLLCGLLEPDPKKRLSADSALNHPYLQERIPEP